jgi:hypothetical protein
VWLSPFWKLIDFAIVDLIVAGAAVRGCLLGRLSRPPACRASSRQLHVSLANVSTIDVSSVSPIGVSLVSIMQTSVIFSCSPTVVASLCC